MAAAEPSPAPAPTSAPGPATATATAAARPWWCKQKGNTTEQGKDEDVARVGGGEEESERERRLAMGRYASVISLKSL